MKLIFKLIFESGRPCGESMFLDRNRWLKKGSPQCRFLATTLRQRVTANADNFLIGFMQSQQEAARSIAYRDVSDSTPLSVDYGNVVRHGEEGPLMVLKMIGITSGRKK